MVNTEKWICLNCWKRMVAKPGDRDHSRRTGRFAQIAPWNSEARSSWSLLSALNEVNSVGACLGSLYAAGHSTPQTAGRYFSWDPVSPDGARKRKWRSDAPSACCLSRSCRGRSRITCRIPERREHEGLRSSGRYLTQRPTLMNRGPAPRIFNLTPISSRP